MITINIYSRKTDCSKIGYPALKMTIIFELHKWAAKFVSTDLCLNTYIAKNCQLWQNFNKTLTNFC